MKKTSRNALLLIDGSNFYFKLKSLGLKQIINFRFDQLTRILLEDNADISIKYYIGAVRDRSTPKGEKLFRNQRKLLAALTKQGVQYSMGYLLKADDKYHEKGVDVQMAVDMLVAAYEKTAHSIFVLSSDTDLLPAVRVARAKGVSVIYLGFAHNPSLAMTRMCSSSKLLTKNDIISCLDNES